MTKHFGQDFDFNHPGRASGDMSRSFVARLIPKLVDFLIPLVISALALGIGYWGFGTGG